MRRRVSLILAWAVLLGFPVAVCAQSFEFGTDIKGVEIGRVNGGSASAEMDVVINGNELTAVLRNTSPDEENYGADSKLLSPAIVRFDLDVRSDSGAAVLPTEWQLKGVDASGAETILGGKGASTISWYSVRPADGAMIFLTTWWYKPVPLFNPLATGNFSGVSNNYATMVLTAKFNTNVNLVERLAGSFSPLVQFNYLGWSGYPVAITTPGIPAVTPIVSLPSVTPSPIVTPPPSVAPPPPSTITRSPGIGGGHSPEPGSLIIWGVGLLAAIGWRCRTSRKQRAG